MSRTSIRGEVAPAPWYRHARSWWISASVAGALATVSVPSLYGLQSADQAMPTPTPAISAGETSVDSVTASRSGLFANLGWYAYEPDSDQALAIARAIDNGVAHMFPIMRSIARSRLRSTNKLPQTLQLVIAPESIGTQLDADKPMQLPRDGAAMRWEDGKGDVCDARETVVGDTLTQFCTTARGSSIARYILEDSGEQLERTVHITSPHLSQPIDYATRFHRRPTPGDRDLSDQEQLSQRPAGAQESPIRDRDGRPDSDP